MRYLLFLVLFIGGMVGTASCQLVPGGAIGNGSAAGTSTASPGATTTPTIGPTSTPVPPPSPSPTGIYLIQQSTACSPTNQASTCTAMFASVPPVNSLLVGCGTIDSGTTFPSPPPGYNQVASYSISGAIALYVYWKYAGVNEPTSSTVTASQADWIGWKVRNYAGVNTTYPFSNVAIQPFLPIQLASPTAVSNYPYISGTVPVSCNVANTAMGVTSHTTGATEDYTFYPASQAGDNFVQPYNANEGQTAATPLPTATTYSEYVNWNLNTQGPDALASMLFLVPSASTSPTFMGYVSSITGNGFTANLGISNFSGYGAIPVVTTGATIIGGPVTVGKYFSLTGTINTPTVTATTVNLGATPFPNSPTAPPTPVNTPTPGACATTPPLTNGQEYGAQFTPYSCTNSPWNVPIYSAGTPTYASWSSTVINNQFGGGFTQPLVSYWPGAYDAAHSMYYSKPSDPLVNVTGGCAFGCDHDNGGVPTQVHIPVGARWPGSNTDNHFELVYDTSGVGTGPFQEYDFYNYNYSPKGSGTGGNWQTGDTMSVGTADNCGDWTGGTGFLSNGPGVTAGNQCAIAGLMRANELSNGYINHGLVLIVGCGGSQSGSQSVYPVESGSGTTQCSLGANYGPPLGARLYYDNHCNATSGPVTTANFPGGLPGSGYVPSELAILCALNQYGAFMTDIRPSDGTDQARGMFFQSTGGQMFYAYGNTPGPYSNLTSAPNNWGTQTPPPAQGILGNRYYFPSTGLPWTPNGFTNSYVTTHFHYVDPCESYIPRTC